MPNQATTKWVSNGKFLGFQTLFDPSKIADGANPGGQNTSVNEGDRVSTRPYGYASFSTPVGTPDDYGGQANISSLHTFRKRDGENIMMRALQTQDFGSSIQYLDSETLEWQYLTAAGTLIPYGFTDFNINADQTSQVIFCNGDTNLMYWNGAHGNFASASTAGTFIGTIEQPNNNTDTGVSQGYVAGDTFTINGGNGATAQVLLVVDGAINAYTLINPGTDYNIGDDVLFANGTGEQVGIFEVDTVGGSGEILTMHIVNRGVNYVPGVTYTDISGLGTIDATLRVDTVYNGHVDSYPSDGTAIRILENADGYTTTTESTTNIIGSGTGLTVKITALAANTITLSQTSSITALGFKDTGTIWVGDPASPFDPNAVVQYTYTGHSGDTFYGVSPDPTASGHAVDSSVYQAITTDPTTADDAARGNILINTSNRLFVSGDPRNPQLVYFSEYGNPANIGDTTLVNLGTATDPGVFNLAEGGGRVTDMALQENAIYIFKESIIYQATLTDSFYTITPMKPFDQNSQSSGALYKTVFTGSNMVFMATPDNQILGLGRIETIDYPQNNNISYPILPTIKSYDLQGMRGISYNNKIFMCMSSAGSQGATVVTVPGQRISVGTQNDRVLIWNTNTKQFDSPIVGWNVRCWTIYDAGDGNGPRLYFGSEVDPNVYLVTNTPTDGDFDVQASWLSKRYDFGNPTQQKWSPNFFLYGRILPSATVTVKVYFNEEGSTQTYTGSFSGTDTAKLFGRTDNNAFGESPFGVQVFGDQQDTTGLRYFRVYFVKNVRAVPFYNIQMEFSSSGQNQYWEILDYAFEVGVYENEENRNLYSAFTPAST